MESRLCAVRAGSSVHGGGGVKGGWAKVKLGLVPMRRRPIREQILEKKQEVGVEVGPEHKLHPPTR